MSIDQRRDLIRRLSLASEDGMAARRRSMGPREVQIVVTVVSAVILVPWIVYLAVALPRVYVTHNWDEAWVGFDILLLLLLVATAVFGYLRRQMVMLIGFASRSVRSVVLPSALPQPSVW